MSVDFAESSKNRKSEFKILQISTRDPVDWWKWWGHGFRLSCKCFSELWTAYESFKAMEIHKTELSAASYVNLAETI
jgi:hypothetical protein